MRRHFTDTHGRRRGGEVWGWQRARVRGNGRVMCRSTRWTDVQVFRFPPRNDGVVGKPSCARGEGIGAGKGVGGNPPLSQKRPKEVRGDPKAGGRKTTPQSRDHGRRLQHRWCRRGGTQRTLGVGIDWKHKVVDERLDGMGMAHTQRACGGVVMGRRTVGQKL
jgi:hypothetical protein